MQYKSIPLFSLYRKAIFPIRLVQAAVLNLLCKNFRYVLKYQITTRGYEKITDRLIYIIDGADSRSPKPG